MIDCFTLANLLIWVIRENKVIQKSNILYVGYYSQNLHNRWFYKKNDLLYSWHSENLDPAVNEIVANTPVSLWISANPFSKDGYNISKEIEDTILKECANDLNLTLNKTGKSLKDYHNSPTVLEILKFEELLDKTKIQ